jgi:predicted acyl esterase
MPRLLAAAAAFAVVVPVGALSGGALSGGAVSAGAVPSASPTPGWLAAKASALRSFTAPPAAAVSLAPGSPGPGYATYSVQATVWVGPGNGTQCSIVGELLVPSGVTASSPQPAVMVTNGFGGSYNDATTLGIAENAATDGFVALSYSGLGFGGSGCQIELDSPAWDGKAASELISWMGTLPYVTSDGPDDPRIGMMGGSYGGGVQFSTASIDPRLDAIVPVITWNDLSYSLAPANDSTADVRTDNEPGVTKWEWASLFFGDGISGFTPGTSSTPTTCPDFDPAICQAFLTTLALGYPDRATTDLLRSDSMVTFWKSLHLPVLLAQGENDSLFNIQEAVDNYKELHDNGDPVQLVLQSWGHSGLTAAPGEFTTSAPFNGYENILVGDFFDKWLRNQNVSTGAAVQYFRPWVSYTGSAAPAYGSAPSWPPGPSSTYYLSGNGSLVSSAADVAPGSATFVNPPGGIGTSYSETSAVQDQPPFSDIPPVDPPGTATSFLSAPLRSPLDVVGVPTVTVQLSSSVPAGIDPATDPVIFGKLYDVSPTGQSTLVDSLVSPVRVASTTGPLTITLPGMAHQYAAGDQLKLVLSAGDDAYLGNRVPDTYTVTVVPGQAGVLSIPAVSPSNQASGGPPPAGE